MSKIKITKNPLTWILCIAVFVLAFTIWIFRPKKK